MVVSGHFDGTLRFWDMRSARATPSCEVAGLHSGQITSVAAGLAGGAPRVELGLHGWGVSKECLSAKAVSPLSSLGCRADPDVREGQPAADGGRAGLRRAPDAVRARLLPGRRVDHRLPEVCQSLALRRAESDVLLAADDRPAVPIPSAAPTKSTPQQGRQTARCLCGMWSGARWPPG